MEPLDFQPTAATLGAVLDALDDAGTSGGGIVTPALRRRALAAYQRVDTEATPMPRGWRHPYDRLPFRDLVWSTGRVRVPAVANGPTSTGIVHLASTYVETPPRAGVPLALADARRRDPAAIDAIHGRIVPFDRDRFTALATAFQNCGAYVDVPAGTQIAEPLQIVWTSRPGATSAVFPHTVVRIGAGASATIVERHLGESESFVAGIVEIELDRDARLEYVVVQNADDGARIIVRRGARCARGAAIGWHVADLGGALARSALDVELAGVDAATAIDTLNFTRAFQNADTAVRVAHDAAHTRSRTIARAVASERSRGRFRGDIAIGPNVDGVDASLREAGLMLSRDAALDVTPALEIASNRVAAYHAATIGSLDEEHLFYVQSRGISRRTAERMMALAFCEPAIAGFPSDALRDEVRTLLDERLDDVPETFAS